MIENLFIFKTNIDKGERINGIKMRLDNSSSILSWYLDQEDIDNVLKVETDGTMHQDSITNILTSNGYICKLLTDEIDK